MDNRETDSGARYERKDIRLRWLLVLMAGVCCFAVIHYYATWRFFWWQENAEEAKESPYAIQPSVSTELPREPRLEQLDRMAKGNASNVSKRLLDQEKMLNSYGPTEEKGFVHIPIQQAMAIVAGTLPVREPPSVQASKSGGLRDGGESNSGRMFRGDRP